MSTVGALVLAGGLMVVFGAISCWGLIDVVRNVWNPRTGSRVGEHRFFFVAYVVLIVLIPEVVALFCGWLFLRVLVTLW